VTAAVFHSSPETCKAGRSEEREKRISLPHKRPVFLLLFTKGVVGPETMVPVYRLSGALPYCGASRYHHISRAGGR